MYLHSATLCLAFFSLHLLSHLTSLSAQVSLSQTVLLNDVQDNLFWAVAHYEHSYIPVPHKLWGWTPTSIQGILLVPPPDKQPVLPSRVPGLASNPTPELTSAFLGVSQASAPKCKKLISVWSGGSFWNSLY